jgi:arginine/lysine/ornithine decarboxylase
MARCRFARSSKRFLNLKADGRLNRAKMVDLTNCTFDGHIYNTRRVMEECLAIKPDSFTYKGLGLGAVTANRGPQKPKGAKHRE